MTYPAPLPPFKPRPIAPLFPAPDLSEFEKTIGRLARQLAQPYRPTFPLPTVKKEAPAMPDYRYEDAEGDRLLIQPRGTAKPEAHVAAPDGVFIPKDKAPAVALAILEASGHGLHDLNSMPAAAMRTLKRHIEREVRKAEDAAKLDAEALALLNAATGENYVSLSNVGTIADFWRRAAGKARELHASK